jgi:Arc/MetJ-type ribon-helix-helix transcriptional regulator
MAQLSISIDADTEARLEREVKEGDFQSKSELVKRAIVTYLRELAYERILRSEREYADGKFFVLKGSLKEHMRKTKV